MNKFFQVISSILIALTLVACEHNVNAVEDYELPSNELEAEVNTNNNEIEDVIDSDINLDNLITNDITISNDGHLDTSELPLIRLSKEQFDEFLYDLVANPNPEEGVLFVSADVTEEHVIELTLDLKAGSLEAAWISPIWDLLIRQLYVNSEYQAEPTIIISDINGEIISNRSEGFGQN